MTDFLNMDMEELEVRVNAMVQDWIRKASLEQLEAKLAEYKKTRSLGHRDTEILGALVSAISAEIAQRRLASQS